jgi:hypothetical protein
MKTNKPASHLAEHSPAQTYCAGPLAEHADCHRTGGGGHRDSTGILQRSHSSASEAGDWRWSISALRMKMSSAPLMSLKKEGFHDNPISPIQKS